MAVIPPTTFLAIADRIAAQLLILETAINSTIAITPVNWFFDVTTNDHLVNVETQMIDAAKELDQGFVSDNVLSTITEVGTLVNLLQVQVESLGYNNLNNYLQINNIQVADNFEHWYYITSNSHLQAESVFLSTPQVMGSFVVGTSAVVFTPGQALQSNPTGNAGLAGGGFAGQPVNIVFVSGEATSQSGSVTVSYTLQGVSGTQLAVVSLSAVSAGSVAGTISGNVTSITGVVWTSGLSVSGDLYQLKNSIPRTPTL